MPLRTRSLWGRRERGRGVAVHEVSLVERPLAHARHGDAVVGVLEPEGVVVDVGIACETAGGSKRVSFIFI